MCLAEYTRRVFLPLGSILEVERGWLRKYPRVSEKRGRLGHPNGRDYPGVPPGQSVLELRKAQRFCPNQGAELAGNPALWKVTTRKTEGWAFTAELRA